MGNCISKINKDSFLIFDEVLKSDLSLTKGFVRDILDMSTQKTYAGVHSLIRYPGIKMLGMLQTGVWWRDLQTDKKEIYFPTITK